MERLSRLEKELRSLDGGRLTVRVEGTFLHREIARFLEQRLLAAGLKRLLE